MTRNCSALTRFALEWPWRGAYTCVIRPAEQPRRDRCPEPRQRGQAVRLPRSPDGRKERTQRGMAAAHAGLACLPKRCEPAAAPDFYSRRHGRAWHSKRPAGNERRDGHSAQLNRGPASRTAATAASWDQWYWGHRHERCSCQVRTGPTVHSSEQPPADSPAAVLCWRCDFPRHFQEFRWLRQRHLARIRTTIPRGRDCRSDTRVVVANLAVEIPKRVSRAAIAAAATDGRVVDARC